MNLCSNVIKSCHLFVKSPEVMLMIKRLLFVQALLFPVETIVSSLSLKSHKGEFEFLSSYILRDCLL